MWSGRFSASASSLLDEFNASIMYDRKLYREDIEGSLAHAAMLAKQGILNTEELIQITDGLNQVNKEIESGEFEWNITDEDLHMGIEKRLTAIIGDAGKKLHTARSRNDQVATDFTLYVQDKSIVIKNKLKIFIKTLEVDETLGQLLVAEGFSSIEEIQQVTLEEILKIEAIDENTAKELKERAEDYLKKEKKDYF